jgi:hypothetical protein
MSEKEEKMFLCQNQKRFLQQQQQLRNLHLINKKKEREKEEKEGFY